MLSILVNAYGECTDLLSLADVANDFKDKTRFVSKLKSVVNDMTILDEFKSYSKSYFTEKDL